MGWAALRHYAMCLILYVKALVVTFNLENAFTMIVKTDG